VTPLRKPIATLALFAMLVSACSSGSGLVATVGTDTEITESDLGALYVTETLPVDDALLGAIFAMIAREVLIAGAQTDFGITLDEAAVEFFYQDMADQRDAEGVDTATWLNIPNAGDGMLRFNAELRVLQEQVIIALVSDPAYLDDVFALPTAITTICAKHILTDSEEAANGVIAELEGGADFAELAAEVSDDPVPGGDLGCRQAGVYVSEFAVAALEAPLNEVYGPVQTEFGWHVLIVSERSAPTREEVVADPMTYLTEGEVSGLWQEWFNDQLQVAVVTVEPKYGTWSPVGILPPE